MGTCGSHPSMISPPIHRRGPPSRGGGSGRGERRHRAGGSACVVVRAVLLGYTPNWKNKMYNNMYEVFDPFLASKTWHRDQTADRERFYLALDKVVREAAFDPEEMGDYARARLGIASECGDDDRENAVTRRVTDAWAVRDFLAVTGAVRL
jgi:hypothetical protein